MASISGDLETKKEEWRRESTKLIFSMMIPSYTDSPSLP
jgi:hypothetical protein